MTPGDRRPGRESLAGSWSAHLRDPVAMRRTLLIALIVGTILSAVNQGDHLVHGEVGPVIVLRIAANYITPWIVSSIGYVSARRRAGDGGPS